jgi:hypothetical protein
MGTDNMFSMSAATALHAFEKLMTLGVHLGDRRMAEASQVLDLDWPELARVLPDGGLPRGVTELSAPHAHGGGTTVTLAAMRAAQRAGNHVHCAWIEAEGAPSLYAPEVLVGGVDPERLLVVRAPREALGRVALKVLATGAFSVVAVAQGANDGPRSRGLDERAVRRLALSAEDAGARVLLLTDAFSAHTSWPTALRLELERLPESIHVRVARERRGRTGQARSISLRSRPVGRSEPAPTLAPVRALSLPSARP